MESGTGKGAVVFRAFDVSGIKIDGEKFEQTGRELRDKRRAEVRQRLESFVVEGGAIDGTQMQAAWFPQIHADIFLSHSHADEALAMRLAGWVWSCFQLSVFIDSAVWGNAANLLSIIDSKYCWNQDQETYNYDKRNLSTSHIHMMLAVALAKMIDATECAWVLNTPNAVTSKDAVEHTRSPWMYSEIATMHFVRRREPEAHRDKVKIAKAQREGVEAPPLVIMHQVSLNKFVALDADDLNAWAKAYDEAGQKGYPLDYLYELAPDADE